MNYNLSIIQTKTILEKIKLYVKCNYENIQDNKKEESYKYNYDYFQYINTYKKETEKKIKLEFILCDKALCEIILSDFFRKENNNVNEILVLKILFSFKYDFSNIIDNNSEKIINYINNNNNEITDYLFSLDILENNSDIDLQYKIISRLIKYGIFLNTYKYKLESIKKNNLLKLSFIFNRNLLYKKKLSSLEVFSISVTNYLVTKWDKPLKSCYITNNVINNIEFYCILIIDNLSTFVEQKNAITFFLEEFILLLNPEMKDRLEYYKKICYDYMYAIKSVSKEKENEEKYVKKQRKAKNIFFLMMVFIHIKIKYGDYNPVMLFNISKNFDCPKEIFMSYVDCLHENLTKKEIIEHFMLSKAYSNQDLDFNKKYISYNFYKLKQINHSFILNSGLTDIPLLKLHLIPENNKRCINRFIEEIISGKICFLDFLVEDYRTITEAQLRSAIHLLKSISKKCYIKYKKENDDYKYQFFSIYPKDYFLLDKNTKHYPPMKKKITYKMNYKIENDKFNIFMNLYKLFKVLKALNKTLYDCIKDNFFFMGRTVSLFLDILEKYEPIKSMEKQMDFINNEMNTFLISFYKLYKDKEITKKVTLKYCTKRFFIIIWKYFYNKLQLLSKNQILLEYNFMIEVINFLDEKKSDTTSNYDDFIELEFLPQIFHESDFISHYWDYNKNQPFFNKNRNKIMDLILEKIPDKFIEVSNILKKYCNKYNFINEVNILKKKNSEFLIQYLLNAFSTLNSNEIKNGFNYYKNFLIKNIINSVNDIQNINKEINLNESDIFIDKSHSIKLLNYSFSNEKMNNLITKISELYCEGKNDILFLEILKENITNQYVFNYLINSLSEAQIKEIFQNNKADVIKAIYGYSEINKYDFIQILLNNLKLSFDDNFVTNLIFPSEKEEEFNEMVNFFKKEDIIYINSKEDYINENEQDNEESDKKVYEEDNKEDYKYFFLFNYSLSYNVCKNYEACAILYKYSSSSIPKLNFCKEIVFSLKQIIDTRKIPNSFFPSYKRKDHKYYYYRRKLKIKLKKNYSAKLLTFIQDSINEDKIKELNPSYHELNKLIKLVSKKILAHLDNFNNLDCTIYLFYIIIFIFHKIPFKLKKMICKLELDNYSTFKFNDLIKEDVFEDESSISELELFIILSLLEIKSYTIISIKEYLPKFYSIIEEKYKKFKEFEIPEINCSQPNDDKFIEGFKYILNNKADILINNLIRTYNFYSFIFILEIKNNTLDNDSNTEFYLEKIIYKLLKFSNINTEEPSKIISADITLSLRDFTTKFLSLISPINENQLDLESCNNYLLSIESLCNFILNKFNDDSPYNLSLFHLKIFSENSDKLNELKNKILIQEIKNEIFKRFDTKILNSNIYLKQTFDLYVRNWLDNYLKTDHIINEFSNIEKENSNFIKYLKYLKVNCLILNNLIGRIKFYTKDYINYKDIKITLIEEKDIKKARQNLEDSLYNYGKIFKNIINNDEYNNNNEIDLKISYYFNDEINDYVETCTNQQLYFFLNNKIDSCYYSFFRTNKRKDEYKNELKEIIDVLDYKNINFIIKLFWPFCKDINFNYNTENIMDKNNKEFFKKYRKAIGLYSKLTALDSLEPRLQNCLNWIKMQINKFFYQNLYPNISFNYSLFPFYNNMRLFDSYYGYKNIIRPDIIVNSLRKNGYYIPKDCEKNKNLIKFVKYLENNGPILEYVNYIDFRNLFESIRNTKFHDDDNLNSLFHMRAINYILNGDSLLNIFFNEIIKDKSNSIKRIIVIDEKKINENLNASKKSFSRNNDINDSNNDINISFSQRSKTKGTKYKLKLDDKKLILKKNNKTQIDLIDEKNGKKKNIKIIINYDEKMKNYKFGGKPIIGYSGYIPYKDNFYGKSLEEVVNIIINNNFYLKYQSPKDTRKFEKVIIYNDELSSKKVTNIKKNHRNYFKFDIDETYYEKRKKGKKHIRVNDGYEIKKIFQFDYFGNYSNKKVKFGKRYKKNNKEYPNIFDALFSIRNVGENLEIIQHDISKLLSPYNEKVKFELLMNHVFPNKTEKDIPENWKYFLKNLNEDDNKEDEIKDVGIIKLHKVY